MLVGLRGRVAVAEKIGGGDLRGLDGCIYGMLFLPVRDLAALFVRLKSLPLSHVGSRALERERIRIYFIGEEMASQQKLTQDHN